jgi:HPt (histidine-containing phosphotransfer) domain-containing protein
MTSNAVLDTEALDRIRRFGGEHLLQKMADLFRQSCPERRDEISASLATGDIRVVERVSHSLKSSAGNLGMHRLQELCMRLESASRTDDIARCSEICAGLDTTCSEALRSLNELVPPTPLDG